MDHPSFQRNCPAQDRRTVCACPYSLFFILTICLLLSKARVLKSAILHHIFESIASSILHAYSTHPLPPVSCTALLGLQPPEQASVHYVLQIICCNRRSLCLSSYLICLRVPFSLIMGADGILDHLFHHTIRS